MAKSSSVISVSIIGDAKKLTSSLNTAEKKVGGFGKGTALALGGLLGGLALTDKAFEFIGDSLKESDRLGDSLANLTHQIGPEFTKTLNDTADDFARIGASRQDMLEMETIFADWATSVGIADAVIGDLADDVAATAAALALTDAKGRSAEEMTGLLTKAMGGSAKAAKELGVTLDSNLTPAQQLTSILAQLKPKVDDLTTGTKDLEQAQREMGAQIETLQGQLGQQLEPALLDVLGILTTLAGHDWGKDFARIGWGIGEILTPLARANDLLQTFLTLVGRAANTPFQTSPGRAPRGAPGSGTDRNTAQEYQRWLARNGLGD